MSKRIVPVVGIYTLKILADILRDPKNADVVKDEIEHWIASGYAVYKIGDVDEQAAM